MLRFPQSGPKQFEPGGGHIDGTRQGNGLTVYPTHFLLLVMAYLTDTDEHDGAFTVWPGSPRQVFSWAYSNNIDLGEKWRTTGSTGAPDIPAQRSNPRCRAGRRRGDMPLSNGTRQLRQPGRPRPRWASRMAQGSSRISIRPENRSATNGLDPVGLDIENRQFTMRKEVLLMPISDSF